MNVPAMLITGDTAPDRIEAAQASGFLLLHKPVPSGRLRAAIANLIRAAERELAGSGEPQ
jgi:DNA-binding response OmpR family regulator